MEREKNQILYLVIPCYNEQEVLPETSRRLKEKMESLMDRVKVVSHPGKGTTVTLEKRIVSKAGEGDAHR